MLNLEKSWYSWQAELIYWWRAHLSPFILWVWTKALFSCSSSNASDSFQIQTGVDVDEREQWSIVQWILDELLGSASAIDCWSFSKVIKLSIASPDDLRHIRNDCDLFVVRTNGCLWSLLDIKVWGCAHMITLRSVLEDRIHVDQPDIEIFYYCWFCQIWFQIIPCPFRNIQQLVVRCVANRLYEQ